MRVHPLVLVLGAAVAAVSTANAAVTFDATTSDLVQQFRLLEQQGADADALAYADEDLPASVTSRLSSAGLAFAQLSGLQQRALLWDAGAVVAPDGATLVQIYTSASASMANISVSEGAYASAGCTYSSCTDSFGSATKRSRFCTGDQIETVVRCVATDVAGADQGRLSMWATGIADATVVPAPNVVRHDWVDDYSNISYLEFAIHTAAASAQPEWDSCALDSGADYEAAMIIPCGVYNATDSSEWAEPAASPLMTQWLSEIASASSVSSNTADSSDRSGGHAEIGNSAASDDNGGGGGGFNLLYLIPIVVCAVLVGLAVAFVFFRRWRHAERRRMWSPNDTAQDATVPADYFSNK